MQQRAEFGAIGYSQVGGLNARGRLLVIAPDGRLPLAVERAAQSLELECRTGRLADLADGAGANDMVWIVTDEALEQDELAIIRSLSGSAAVILECSRHSVDGVWAALGDDPQVSILIEPDQHERLIALSGLYRTLSGAMHSPVATRHDEQLKQLQDEVARIARLLARLDQNPEPQLGSAPDRSRRPDYAPPSPFIDDHVRDFSRSFGAEAAIQPFRQSVPAPVTAQQVRQMIRLRRARDRFFESDLFADPAWDMLLDLYAARLERTRVAVSSLCIAAAVPATTALRWIKSLTSAGLFDRQADPLDGRRIFVALSDAAADKLHDYFTAIRDEGLTI